MDNGTHNAPDFRNKFFTLPCLDGSEPQPETLRPLNSLQVSATLKCINAAQSLLDLFLNFSTTALRKIPNVLYVRAIYSLTVLLKAEYAIGTDPTGLGELIDSHNLRTGYYIKAMIERSTEAVGPNKCRVPSHWLHVLHIKIAPWHEKYLSLLEQKRHPNQPSTSAQGSDSSTPRSSESDQRTTSADASQRRPLTFLTPNPGEPEFDPLPGYEVRPSISGWPSPRPALTNDIPQSSCVPDQPAISTDMSDFNMAFEQGDLYFWNDATGFGDWTQQGDIYNGLSTWPSGPGF